MRARRSASELWPISRDALSPLGKSPTTATAHRAAPPAAAACSAVDPGILRETESGESDGESDGESGESAHCAELSKRGQEDQQLLRRRHAATGPIAC